MAEQISYLKELIHSNSEFIRSNSKMEKTFKKLVGNLDVTNAFLMEFSKIDTDSNHHLQQLAGDVRNMVCRAEAITEKLIIFRTSPQKIYQLSKETQLHVSFSFKLRYLVEQMHVVSAKVAILLKERAFPGLEALKIGVAANKGGKALVVEEDNGDSFEDEAKTIIEQLEIVSITEMLQKIKSCDPNSLLLGQIKLKLIGHDHISKLKLGHDHISKLKLVQVMDLENSQWDTCFISEIASQVHLRFLATSLTLKSHTLLPSYISNLWSLEILILTGVTRHLKLPETVWNMTRLRHVDVGDCYISNSGDKKHEAYSQPQMVNLESFSSPKIFTTQDLEDLLKRSPFLRKLGFENYIDRQSFHFPKLDSVSKLESLKVSFVGETCLRSFKFLSTLKKLSLSHCYLDWSYLAMISKMPCLEVLKLLHNAFVGLTWDMEDTEFPKLKFLKLQQLRLAEWIDYDKSFPSLEVLIVSRCYNLNKVPPCFGELPSLKRIEVYESDEVAASVDKIREAQKEYGNEELQVIVSKLGLQISCMYLYFDFLLLWPYELKVDICLYMGFPFSCFDYTEHSIWKRSIVGEKK